MNDLRQEIRTEVDVSVSAHESVERLFGMKCTRVSVDQIVAVLEQAEPRMPVADLIRQMGIPISLMMGLLVTADTSVSLYSSVFVFS